MAGYGKHSFRNFPTTPVVVVAGRDGPTTGWRADPAWQDLLRVVALRDLRAGGARELFAARGLSGPAPQQVPGVVRGHPLGLVLPADVADEDDVEIGLQSLADTPEVIDALVTRFVQRVTDEEQQNGQCSVTRRMTCRCTHHPTRRDRRCLPLRLLGGEPPPTAWSTCTPAASAPG